MKKIWRRVREKKAELAISVTYSGNISKAILFCQHPLGINEKALTVLP